MTQQTRPLSTYLFQVRSLGLLNGLGMADRFWVCSSARLERTPDKREVGGSSPPRPTIQSSGYHRLLGA